MATDCKSAQFLSQNSLRKGPGWHRPGLGPGLYQTNLIFRPKNEDFSENLKNLVFWKSERPIFWPQKTEASLENFQNWKILKIFQARQKEPFLCLQSQIGLQNQSDLAGKIGPFRGLFCWKIFQKFSFLKMKDHFFKKVSVGLVRFWSLKKGPKSPGWGKSASFYHHPEPCCPGNTERLWAHF